MIPLVEEKRDAIVTLCKQYGVQKLALFGSAARGDFDPDTSDVDFVVEFADYGPGVGRRFMRFSVELEDVFGRSVDIVFESVINDPNFLEEVVSTQEILYDATESAEAIA